MAKTNLATSLTKAAIRRTIGASDNKAVLGGARAKNLSRYNGNGREWRTPTELFAALNGEFGFTLDPARQRERKCARFFTEADNGLAQDWGREHVFMNPPYGARVTLGAQGQAGRRAGAWSGLLPASTDLAWWHDDVIGRTEIDISAVASGS
jgi:site-specific DNA-methyltransferase (adenine-specific)